MVPTRTARKAPEETEGARRSVILQQAPGKRALMPQKATMFPRSLCGALGPDDVATMTTAVTATAAMAVQNHHLSKMGASDGGGCAIAGGDTDRSRFTASGEIAVSGVATLVAGENVVPGAVAGSGARLPGEAGWLATGGGVVEGADPVAMPVAMPVAESVAVAAVLVAV